MRSVAFVALTAVLVCAPPTAAQLGPLTASVAVGWAFGETLWSIDRQPIVPYIPSQLNQPDDTVGLARSIGGGLRVAAMIAYRPANRISLVAEFFRLDTPVQSACRPIYVASQGSASWCTLKDGESLSHASYGLTAGLKFDPIEGRRLRPYVQGGVGAVTFDESTVAMEGIGGFHPTVIADPRHHRSAATVALGAGVATPLGASRELLVEVRDVMIDLERVTAPADSIGVAPTARRLAHDVVLSLSVRMDLRAVTGGGR
jgi:opacity protein-like surface antigen